jgi:glutaredoxin
MKKILMLLIVGFLILSSFGAVALNSDMEETRSDAMEASAVNQDFTHTVFAEAATKTTCPYCKYSHAALKNIYASGDYPFYYVSLVGNKNSKAYARAKNDYNFYGYPTVWFDGGYRVNVGGGTGNEAQYRSSINACGNRAVEDVDIDLSVSWLGGTEMEIEISVHNNEGSTYGGHIRVYITEIESSMGWKDTANKLYTFPFLDWAFNEPLSVSAGGSWNDSMTWDGSAHGFPSVTYDNIMVIAAVFNDEWHQGYSYPPNQNPFDAYYVDETAAAVPEGENNPPSAPIITGIEEGTAGNSYEYTFESTDPDDDDVSYYIEWGDGDITDWTAFQPSGPPGYSESHAWEKGTWTIRAKAKDPEGLESPWGTLIVTMPRNKAMNINSLFLRLLEGLLSFPVFNRILNLQ